MDAGTLHEAIALVCPDAGTTVGKPNDRATWSFAPGPGATQAQIDAGNNVIATIPIVAAVPISSSDFVARFTNAEYLALGKLRASDFVANKVGTAKNWDILISDPTINLSKQKAQSLKADLVTAGVLTQARADAIFS